MTDAERHLMTIFTAALDRESESERAAYLDEACGSDVVLRERVDALFRAHEQVDRFLEPQVTAGSETSAVTAAMANPMAGTVIAGRYKLIEEIGEGGMGTVWMAQQTEPVKRAVALKLIKPGMDSKQVLARFEAERQALALMDHPNIAKVLDAGTIADCRLQIADLKSEISNLQSEIGAGRPFFVMELVKGVPITKYCDERRLTPRQRLELFVPVCQAVQHAHQKGIIHRDIKPSNILVAQYDGRPVPKVIDFGVAKAAGQQLTDKTLMTGFGAVVGTLEYMSPEQAELNQLDIDTRSDIYSLGVVLYELLTGSTPLDKKRLKQAAFAEVLRIIREEEPPKPSTRLSGSTDSLPSISAQRQMEAAKLTKYVRGELDWIVMKALEKDRNRRYETANGFAMDVQRYLANEPVLACPPSAWYRFRKFARRNRTALAAAAAALFFFALMGGGAVWVMQDRAARQAGEANDLELALDRTEMLQKDGKPAAAEAALAHAELLAGRAAADPVREARVTALKERLAADARDQEFITRFDDIRLRAQTRVDVEVSHFTVEAAFPEIRDALHRYGIVIGATAPAEAAARVQARPERVRRELIAALVECFRHAPQADSQARQWLLDTLAAADNDPWRLRVRKAYLDRDEKVTAQLARQADTDKQPASFLIFLADSLPRSMSVTRLELLRRIQRAYPADLWANVSLAVEYTGNPAEAVRYYTAALVARPDSAGIYINRGKAFVDARELEDAIADFREAIRLRRDYAAAHYNLGSALCEKRKLDEAIAALREAIRLKKNYADAYNNLGVALRHKGQFDQAVAACREAVRLNKDHAVVHNNLGAALRDQGELDEASAAFREAIRLQKDYAMAYYNLGLTLRDKGQSDQAIAAFRAAISLKKDYAECYYNLGYSLDRKGELDQAIAAFRAAIRLKKGFVVAHYKLGNALYQKKDVEGAIREYQAALKIASFADAHCDLGAVLRDDKGDPEGAIREFQAALATDPKHARARGLMGAALRKVIKDYDEAIAREPKSPSACSARADFYIRLGLLDLAAADLAKAFPLQAPASAHLWFCHALLRVRVGDTEGYRKIAAQLPQRFTRTSADPSANELARALTLAPVPNIDLGWAAELAELDIKKNRGAWSYNALGLVHYRAGKYEQALGSLREALRLDSRWHHAILSHSVLAMAYQRLERAAEARQALNQAAQQVEQWQQSLRGFPLDPLGGTWWDLAEGLVLYREAKTLINGSAPTDDPRWHLARAVAFVALEDHKKANDSYKKAIALGATADQRNRFAQVYLDLLGVKFANPGRAVALAKRAIDFAPREGIFWNALGTTQYRAGDWKAAVAALDKSMELRKGGDSFDWFLLAMAYWQLGNKEKARTWFDQSVRWTDEHKPADQELRRLRIEAAELLRINDRKT